MKTFKLPVVYTETGWVEIEASSKEEAIESYWRGALRIDSDYNYDKSESLDEELLADEGYNYDETYYDDDEGVGIDFPDPDFVASVKKGLIH